MIYYLISFIILMVASILLVRLLKPTYSKRASIIKELKKLDFNDGKNSAYKFTSLARELELSDREQRLFEDIFDMLKEYKYKPSSSKIDRATKTKIEIFIQSVE